MTISRTLWFGALLVAAGFGISSCLSPPDYPETPEIDFKSITKQRVNTARGDRDTVVITISFKDGDGDLGLAYEDTTGLYTYRGKNRYYNNYFFQPQLRNSNGEFENFDPGNGTSRYDGRYPRLSPTDQGDRKEPLKGDLNFGVVFPRLAFPRASVVRFKVRIADRALHESNEVITDPINID